MTAFPRSDELTSSLPLNETPKFTQIDPANYRDAFQKRKRCSDHLAERIDEYLTDLRTSEHELLQDASERRASSPPLLDRPC